METMQFRFGEWKSQATAQIKVLAGGMSKYRVRIRETQKVIKCCTTSYEANLGLELKS